MDKLVSAVILAADISRELRGWIVLLTSLIKEKSRDRDCEVRENLSQTKPPLSFLLAKLNYR